MLGIFTIRKPGIGSLVAPRYAPALFTLHATGPATPADEPVGYGEQTLTLRKAWDVYDHWLEDSRVEFYPEPNGLEPVFREATAPFAGKAAHKWVGDCYLLAYAKHSASTLATFDKGLYYLARKQHCSAIEPR